MTENNWIKFEDELPKLGKEIEVFRYNETIEKTKSRLCGYCESMVFDVKGNSYLHHNSCQLKGWRYPPEKRPDFSKLKGGDSIILETKEGSSIILETQGLLPDFGLQAAFFDKIDDSVYPFCFQIYSNSSSCRSRIKLEEIKKITRINVKEKTFEEI